MRSIFFAVMLASCGNAYAQDAPVPLKLTTSLEVRILAEHVTGGFGDWREAGVVVAHAIGDHVIEAELSAKERFHVSATFVGLMDTYTIDPDWYAAVGAGVGEGAFFLPRLRLDALLHRKVGNDRNTVLYTGPGYARSPDGHTDRLWTLGFIRYFEAPWIVQAGVRFNESNPGKVRTRREFAAVTYGREGADRVTLRAEAGREGYLPIGLDLSLVDFSSREATLQWRHWLTPGSGVSLAIDHYRNPYYERSGAILGWFGAW